MKANSISLHRLWMLFAQAVTVGAGLLIAWHAFGPVASPPPVRNDVVTIHEAAGSSSSLASTILGRRDAGYRSAARKASASVVNIYTRSASSRRSRRGQESLSLGSGV